MSLTNADLSEGDVVEFDLADGRTARYRVREEWTDENLADGMTPGPHAERVWSSDVNLESPLPRYRATLDLDAGRLVDNYPEEDRGDVSVRRLAKPRLVDVADRWEVRGSVDSPAASHVRRVVADALENDPLASTIEPENVVIKGADESGAGVFGDDLGLTIHILASLDLQVREAFESYLHERLNAGYWWELERDGVFTFLVDRDGETNVVR